LEVVLPNDSAWNVQLEVVRRKALVQRELFLVGPSLLLESELRRLGIRLAIAARSAGLSVAAPT
jgi:hypothetical protein